MTPFIGGLISRGKCTLDELRTVYSVEDALTIWESTYVPLYNDMKNAERVRDEQERRARLGR